MLGEQAFSTPYLENALPGQEMNQMPKGLCAPAETIRRNRVAPHKIFVPSLLAKRKGLEYHLDATMERAGWVVLSVTHWPGWRAYVDGNRVRTHHANHAFLGVYIPQGKHRVRLVYLPESFTRGRAISLFVLFVLLVLLVPSVLSSRRCSPSSSTPRSPSR